MDDLASILVPIRAAEVEVVLAPVDVREKNSFTVFIFSLLVAKHVTSSLARFPDPLAFGSGSGNLATSSHEGYLFPDAYQEPCGT